MEDWITAEQAAKLLKVTAEEVQQLIDSGELDFDEDFGVDRLDVESLAAVKAEERKEASRKVAKSQRKTRRERWEKGAVGNFKLQIENCKLDDLDVPEWVTVEEMAGMLGVVKAIAYRYVKPLGIRWAMDFEVGMSRAVAGRKVRARRVYFGEDVARAAADRRAADAKRGVNRYEGVGWYGNRADARRLGVGRQALGVGNSITSTRTRTRTILRQAQEPGSRSRVRTGPGALMVGPDGERLLTTKEAAEFLGVGRERMAELARTGRIPCYQRRPGQKGSMLYFRWDQVASLKRQEGYRERREAYDRYRGEGVGDVIATVDGEIRQVKTDRRISWEEKGLPEYHPRETSLFTERDYGEYYTTRQAAHLMGVNPGRVLYLRRTGRLQGFRRPLRVVEVKKFAYRAKERIDSGKRWWFFKKTEVDALVRDPEYKRGRRAYKKSLETLAAGPRFPTEEEWLECWRINRFGK